MSLAIKGRAWRPVGKAVILAAVLIAAVAWAVTDAAASARTMTYREHLRHLRYWPIIRDEARTIMPEGWDPLLFWALVRRESRFRTRAVSDKQAYGLTQVRHGAARAVGMARTFRRSPRQNIRCGLKYLRLMYRDEARGFPAGARNNWQRTKAAMTAYISGPGTLRRAKSWLRRRKLAYTWDNLTRALSAVSSHAGTILAYVRDIFVSYDHRRHVLAARQALARDTSPQRPPLPGLLPGQGGPFAGRSVTPPVSFSAK
ncbi:MAG: transglycosylase SLT domain-containing protein [Proteobacteria bacterium]|nr:transglycosylase SLT domain-containing protein [Pseudomonadota bacterium]MBU1742646.1 transglycosylase SLT domain-containing protein [Pseudomonadota bacterium]